MATINKNSIAFIGLANEYCQLLEQVAEIEKDEFVNELLRLLPRLYISISDMESIELESEIYIESYLEEVYYDSIRRNIETVIGEDDTFLEVFEEDMKYSDTPIAVSISEYLADIFQYPGVIYRVGCAAYNSDNWQPLDKLQRQQLHRKNRGRLIDLICKKLLSDFLRFPFYSCI